MERVLTLSDEGVDTDLEVDIKNLESPQALFMASVFIVAQSQMMGIPKEIMLDAVADLWDKEDESND